MASQEEWMKKDLAMMQNPDSWIRYPVLPVKAKQHKSGDFPDTGFLIPNGKPIVYLGNIFSLKSGPIGQVVAGLPTKEYPSFLALALEWMVD